MFMWVCGVTEKGGVALMWAVRAVCVASVLGLALAACTGGGSGNTGDPQDKIVLAFEGELQTYNPGTAEGGAAQNRVVLQWVLPGFWYLDDDATITPNPEVGTYEKVSDDPLAVELSFHEDAAWSDGTPIDCDDVILYWAAHSGAFDAFSSSAVGVERTEPPTCEAGEKRWTTVFTEPFADWEVAAAPSGLLPAHVAIAEAGLTEEEFIAAVKKRDAKALQPVAEFFNTGWVMQPGELPDKSLIPSAGPYELSAWDAGQSITLEANPDYWGEPPATEAVVIRFIPQEEQVKALANGEVDVIAPQPNPDLHAQLEDLDGVTVATPNMYFYEHLDFNFDAGPFQDRRLREAFAKCVPRQLIVDNLVAPQSPDARVMDARTTFPFESGYDIVTSGSGASDYAEPDIDGARAILANSGNEGVEVRIGYATPNQRRTDTVALIADSCGKAGFTVVDQGDPDFTGPEGGLVSTNFDVALFAWAGDPLVSGWAGIFASPEECTPRGKGMNVGCFANDSVDRLIAEINAEPDQDRQTELIAKAESILWEELATVPLYSHPGLFAWADDIENVRPNPTQESITWNMHRWVRSASS